MRRLFALLAMLALQPALAAPPPATVPKLDLTRFSGTWYEVARKPIFFERFCAHDVTARYRPAEDGSLKVEHRCRTKSGVEDLARGKARPIAGSRNAKLKVNVFSPFVAPYWVLWLDTNYRAVLLGTPNRKYLWLLSRTPKLEPELENAALEQAKRQGYTLEDLIRTPHSDVSPDKHEQDLVITPKALE
jgi:apolipoprotein D and lipocalin family protein